MIVELISSSSVSDRTGLMAGDLSPGCWFRTGSAVAATSALSSAVLSVVCWSVTLGLTASRCVVPNHGAAHVHERSAWKEHFWMAVLTLGLLAAVSVAVTPAGKSC